MRQKSLLVVHKIEIVGTGFNLTLGSFNIVFFNELLSMSLLGTRTFEVLSFGKLETSRW